MRRGTQWAALLVSAALLCGGLSGCGGALASENSEAFPISGVQDTAGSEGIRTYQMTADKTDSYAFSCEGADLGVYKASGSKLSAGSDAVTAALTAGETYTVQVKAQPDAAFELTVTPQTNGVRLPYENHFATDAATLDTQGDAASDPLQPAEINYQKREGGTYIFLNNPEMFGAQDVGKAFERDAGLTGEVYVTFEHANYAAKKVYLGYQLLNAGDTDVYVTVQNVGYQTSGEWFGQQSWSDFYNTQFTLPEDFFQNGKASSKYTSKDLAFIDYAPRLLQPVTYRLPAGQYFYVVGGTTADAYNGINVGGTADKLVGTQKCANAAAKFVVTGGTVTGTMFAYDDPKQVQANPKEQGYLTLRGGKDYSAQYLGTAAHSGVIDNNMTWTVNDSSPKGKLPVTYTNYYDEKAASVKKPYAAYNSQPHKVAKATSWMTHINPQNEHGGVGMDLVAFTCRDARTGEQVTVDNDHADGGGNPANTANWMIEYQDNLTFVNQGDNARSFSVYLKDNGAFATLIRDAAGNVLETKMTMGKGGSDPKIYTLTVEPHSVGQITVDYLMLACSYGTATHWVEMK